MIYYQKHQIRPEYNRQSSNYSYVRPQNVCMPTLHEKKLMKKLTEVWQGTFFCNSLIAANTRPFTVNITDLKLYT